MTDDALKADGRRGKVINIASIISYIGGKNITPYAASKGGVMQVTKAMSNEWAEKGIQCRLQCTEQLRHVYCS